jgi:hypothetical protein
MKRVEQKDESFERIVQIYLERKPHLQKDVTVSSELEIRFQAGKRPFSKTDYENVVRHLYAGGWSPVNGDVRGVQMLRMYAENMKETRVELSGSDIIQDYCFSNSLETLLGNPKHRQGTQGTSQQGTQGTGVVKVKLTQKMSPQDDIGRPIPYVDVKPFRFRVSYKMERDTPLFSEVSLKQVSALQDWKNQKKTFRYMNRVRFEHPDLPVFADLSIIKMSKKPEYTLQDSGVLNLPPLYEIELEVDNARCRFMKPAELLTALRKSIRVVMEALQGSSFPISFVEQDTVFRDYFVMVHNGTKKREQIEAELSNMNDLSRYFIGPSSKTLQWENMQGLKNATEEGDINRITIQQHYTVTDKADGERKMLFIGSEGRIYFIDMNMNISYTGSKTDDKELFMTLLDGEHIRIDKRNKVGYLFAAFDVYYIRGKNCRTLPFVKVDGQQDESDDSFRLYLLESVCSRLVITNTSFRVENPKCYLIVRCKQFYSQVPWLSKSGLADSTSLIAVDTIWEGCRRLLQGGMNWDYETDGLIFTPCKSGVGGLKNPLEVAFKRTWDASFKWKPPHYNTVDFMVRIVKDATGKRDLIQYDSQGGGGGSGSTQPYKMLTLWCGCNPARDLKNTFCQHVLNDTLPNTTTASSVYKPVRFVPSVDPYDSEAYFCKMYLLERSPGVFVIPIEGTQEFLEENTIVEFRYDVDEPEPKRRWRPIRVRHDKTEQLQLYHKNFGNSYEVANTNWYSIHHPVTEAMLRGEEEIPHAADPDEDVYFNRKTDDRVWQKTRSLRDFHNKYVKGRLIRCAIQMAAAAKVGTKEPLTLVDLAVGKAGDLHKWTESPLLRFVLGIDLFRDNITNAVDGACKRFIEWRQKNRHKPFRAIFLQGDCGQRILDGGDAFGSDAATSRRIVSCLIGKTRDSSEDHRLVQQSFAIAKTGFHICSCQFAIHYFFENRRKLNEFLRNVCELTADGGYFIGTCYDGQTVFEKLRGASLPIMATYPHSETGEPVQMFRIERKYTQDVFVSDVTSLGYRIDVYQETINKVFPEYLVNFEYLVRLIAEYGFDLVEDAKTREYGLGSPTGLFENMFEQMTNGGNANEGGSYGSAANMTDSEKTVSFLNRYFIFRKNRAANADLVFNKQMRLPTANEQKEDDERELALSSMTTPVTLVNKRFEIATEDSDTESDTDEE